MKDTLIWVKNNLSHMFSILGIILTVYFSVFYVPKYSEDIKIRRIDSVNQEIISTLQELIYNKHEVDERNIETLIKGKEIKTGIVYPFSIDELLIQVQEGFLSNKFIPLAERKNLVDEIDSIRSSINSSPLHISPTGNVKYFNWYFLLSFLGVAVSILGATSLVTTTKKIKDDEMEIRISEEKDNFQDRLKKALALEDSVEKILNSKFGNDRVNKDVQGDFGVDFLVNLEDGRRIGFEVKMTDAEIIPGRLISFIFSKSKKLKIPIVLLSNSELSINAKKRIDHINSRSSDLEKIYFSSIENLEEFLSREF